MEPTEKSSRVAAVRRAGDRVAIGAALLAFALAIGIIYPRGDLVPADRPPCGTIQIWALMGWAMITGLAGGVLGLIRFVGTLHEATWLAWTYRITALVVALPIALLVVIDLGWRVVGPFRR